ncbi:MAG: hypothetical protein CVV48_01995 [Spirochaetae bacterium HGW-Spirochaetae-4]|nr:MAG: hypothetical protein CVV52_16185 [Spirochaetae bacterium HGW-Spirochaetae-8]PKL22582.1 MAG: hypothetical protein CVV48_01995 [Spirochaetae bacterium HGW-Spirochaetae-4]
MLYIRAMKKLKIENPGDFIPLVASHIQLVAQVHADPIRVGLPGGRGAVSVVQGLLACDPSVLERVELYLVDERLTGPTNRDTLLDVGLHEAIERGVFSESQLHIPHMAESFFPEGCELDLLYLGVGEDGHVASLFPGSYPELDAKDTGDTAYVTDSPKPPPERVTVTYRGFRRYAKKAQTYLLFFGEGKRLALERFLEAKENPSSLPCMFFPREWFPVDIVTDL